MVGEGNELCFKLSNHNVFGYLIMFDQISKRLEARQSNILTVFLEFGNLVKLVDILLHKFGRRV